MKTVSMSAASMENKGTAVPPIAAAMQPTKDKTKFNGNCQKSTFKVRTVSNATAISITLLYSFFKLGYHLFNCGCSH